VSYLKEGLGIRSIARLLGISVNTVMSRIKKISTQIRKPTISFNKEYQMDEMRTYIGQKKRLVWIAYAIRKDTREVVDFKVGPRTNRTLRAVIETLKVAKAKAVYTDKLPSYKVLIPRGIHKTVQRGINYIERKNLTLRTHLKRLNRKTISFSKSLLMLTACLRIYFWGKLKENEPIGLF
jgi:IS1 family transposase